MCHKKPKPNIMLVFHLHAEFNKYNVSNFSSNTVLSSYLCSIFWLKTTLLNFMAPFYGWGSTDSRLQPLRGGSLLFTIQFPEIPGTHFIDLGRMKGWVDLGATQWFFFKTIALNHDEIWMPLIIAWIQVI